MDNLVYVLQVMGILDRGGAESMIMNIYRQLDRTKFQFDFVVHQPKEGAYDEEVREMGGRIYIAPTYVGRNHFEYKKWWNQFFHEHKEYRIVHSHVRSTASIVLSIAKKNGCKTIAHSHSTSSGRGLRAAVKNILQYRIRYTADYFMGCSQEAGEWLFGKKICSSDRYFNVRNAIDAKKYVYDENIAKSLRKELGYSDDDFVIGHVGRFSEPKNHAFLLDVFAEVHRKDDKYKLLLVGDGELRTEIEQKINSLDLSKYVQLTGTRSDVNKLMMAMDLFLFPSKWEGLPVSVIEAQASGLPCIISSVITNEVCITSLVKRMNLNQSSENWASYICEKKTVIRKNTLQEIIAANYDIHESLMWLMNFYMRLNR